jgi:diadenosine tetraphosphatase ApaH/serine/threonine PP2A family protein phosphatase
MRYAILSDVHGNADALHAVFDDIDHYCDEHGGTISQVWCLGDVVGYGPEPAECVRLVRMWCDVCIPGNHDWAAVGKLALDDFGEAAAQSAHWTREQLSAEERVYLLNLPAITQVANFTLAHGSPANPIWEYVTTAAAAAPNFAAFKTVFCLVGHSHLPMIFLQPMGAHPAAAAPLQRALSAASASVTLAMGAAGGPSQATLEHLGGAPGASGRWAHCQRLIPAEGLWVLPPGYRAIINPGSVGQPRDGNPHAAYLIYDSEVGFDFRRVPYNVAATQRKIRETGLSPQFAARLTRGI